MRFLKKLFMKSTHISTNTNNNEENDARAIIVLAAGKGTRMNMDLPKVLAPVAGSPMISHVLETIADIDMQDSTVIVTGYQHERVEEVCGPGYRYALQEEQLGTGHAVEIGLTQVPDHVKTVLVLYGDMPLVSGNTILSMMERHEAHDSPLSLATVHATDEELEQHFYAFGRIVRDDRDNVIKIVEKKDATEDELAIHEVNPAVMCFDYDWLVSRIASLEANNAQAELYLTELVARAFNEFGTVMTVDLPSDEAYGANTPEQLSHVEKVYLKNR